MIIYVVKEGDTLTRISENFGVSMEQIIWANQLEYPYHLVIGQSLLLLTEVIQEYRNLFANGFAYPFINSWILEQTLPYLSELSVFSYGFTTDGNLIPPSLPVDWMIETALSYGCTPILTLTPFGPDGTFSNQLIHSMLSNETAKDTLMEQLRQEMQYSGYGGVNVDFEYILAEDRDLFTEFVRALTIIIEETGGEVTVDLAPKTSDTQQGLLYEGKDYRALGDAATRVFVMTYEWGYTYGPPMAVAPIDKVKQVLDYATSVIPKERITMGIPNYGYDWELPFVRGETKAQTIGNIEAVQIAIANGATIFFDNTAQSPFFHYVVNNVTHEVWFEDARSILAKYRLLQSYPLFGFGCWQIMRLFRPMWLLSAAELDYVEIVE